MSAGFPLADIRQFAQMPPPEKARCHISARPVWQDPPFRSAVCLREITQILHLPLQE
jgi:hypothetical protein